MFENLAQEKEVGAALAECKEHSNQKQGKYSYFELIQQFKEATDKYDLNA